MSRRPDRRLPASRLARTALVSGLFVCSACDDDLPNDDGVWHLCGATVHIDGAPTVLHQTRICADRGLPQGDYEDACAAQCEDDFSYFCAGLGIDEAREFELFTCGPDCVATNVLPTSESCRNASIVPGPPPLGQASIELRAGSTASVTVGDEASGALAPAGALHYTAASCAAPPCTFQLAAFRFTVPDFQIAGVPITGVLVQSAGLATGIIDGAGAWSIPAGALKVSTNFVVDGDGASITLTNTSAVVGAADPGSDVFTVSGTFRQDEVEVRMELRGTHANLPPRARVLPSGDVECTSPEGASVLLDGRSSTDPEGFADIATFRWMIDGVIVGSGATLPRALPFGPSEIGLGLLDRSLARAIAFETATVVDTTPPVVAAPADARVECAAPSGTPVLLGAARATDVCDDVLEVAHDAPASFPLGRTLVTWSAVDDAGNTGTGSQQVLVEDTTPPVLELTVSPTTLWPPDHRLVPITASVVVQDACDARPSVRLVSIVSDEEDEGLGDGDQPGDVQGAVEGTDDRAFALRAERSGLGDGRVYTITFEARDGSGNTTTTQATVRVPLHAGP